MNAKRRKKYKVSIIAFFFREGGRRREREGERERERERFKRDRLRAS